jgi:hypothetical protein
MKTLVRLSAVVFFMLAAGACSDDDSDDPVATATTGVTAVVTTPAPTAAQPVGGLPATQTAVASPGAPGIAAFRAFAAQIQTALDQKDTNFFRSRARTQPVTCTAENTPPRGAGGPACVAIGDMFVGFSSGNWRSEGSIIPIDRAMANIERFWDEIVPGATDQFGGSEPRVYATGRMTTAPGSPQIHTAVITAIIRRPADFVPGGPLRVVLVPQWQQDGNNWVLVGMLLAFVLAEEFLIPAAETQGWVGDYQRFP